jgi:threonine synthase
MYGAHLHRIPGSREDTARAAFEAAEECFYASHSWNPFFFQGTKPFAFEIWEQMGRKAPDTLLIPAGNGTLLIGAYLGFKDLLRQGFIQHIPKIIAVQAQNCCPIYNMFEKTTTAFCSGENHTIAEGIAIREPVRGSQIVDILRETGGHVIIVSEEEIKYSLLEICRSGIYIEPTSASVIAAIRKYRMSQGESVAVPLTGSGLKSTEKLLKLLEKP